MNQSLVMSSPLGAGNHNYLVDTAFVSVEGNSLEKGAPASCQHSIPRAGGWVQWLVKVVWVWHQQHLLELYCVK